MEHAELKPSLFIFFRERKLLLEQARSDTLSGSWTKVKDQCRRGVSDIVPTQNQECLDHSNLDKALFGGQPREMQCQKAATGSTIEGTLMFLEQRQSFLAVRQASWLSTNGISPLDAPLDLIPDFLGASFFGPKLESSRQGRRDRKLFLTSFPVQTGLKLVPVVYR